MGSVTYIIKVCLSLPQQAPMTNIQLYLISLHRNYFCIQVLYGIYLSSNEIYFVRIHLEFPL